MPECPYCLKQFESPQGVTRHLSQPLRSCRAWQDDLVFAADVLAREQETRLGSPAPHSDGSMEVDATFDDDNAHWPVDETMDGDGVDAPEYQPLAPAVVDEDIRMMVDDFVEHQGVSYSVTEFEGAAQTFDVGEVFLDRFDMDTYSFQRKTNIYYPFATRKEWKLAKFLLCSPLSMAQIDQFLKLESTKELNLSFRTAKELRGRAELLPSGPRWKYRIVEPAEGITTSPVYLYLRDTLDCIELLFNHPYFMDKIDLTPQRIFKYAEETIERVYSEWLTGDAAWGMQSELPAGSTLLGVILSSDKTNITNMSGGRVAHPLLISLANIKMNHRNKASNHAFLLAALLPVVQFTHPNSRIRTVLNDRLTHQCLDIILEPLKQAARVGRMMSDPRGNLRLCYTTLASYICDTPEAGMLSCVRGLTSHVTMAMYKDFGDSFRHPPRLGKTTLRQLASIGVRPGDVEAFFAACEKFRLSGVSEPFWRDWPLSEPSVFLTPEALHHWLREFYDHDFQWCLYVLSKAELDFRYSILTPIVGLRHFATGVSGLKQVTGRVHRDLQRYIVAVIAGAATPRFVRAIRALVEFRYLAQAPVITETTRTKIASALQEFHDNKQVIIDLGARRGKKGVIKHWHIPKLELMQSIATSVTDVGSLLQWSADTTEHAHINLIKNPAESSNNKDYHSQICRYLDRQEKCRLFDDAIALTLAGHCDNPDTENEDSEELNHDEVAELEASHPAVILADLWGPNRQVTNFFEKAEHDARVGASKIWPPRSFVACSTAIHLNYDPSLSRITVDEAAELFSLPDLRGALADYISRERSYRDFHDVGQARRAAADAPLPFDHLQLWFKVRVQRKSFHDTSVICPTFTINAAPPDGTWKHGRYDAAIFALGNADHWPVSGLTGHFVAQVRMILRPIPPKGTRPVWAKRYLAYVQRLEVRSNSGAIDPVTHMHILKRSMRSRGTTMGGILPLDQIRSYAHITPMFGKKADPRLTSANSLHFADTFYLNHYFDKDFFYAICK